MGADREPRLSASEYDASVVIAVQNPGDDTAAGNTPPPMLAMPVQSADERAAAAAAGAADEPVVLHVRCSGCGLVVQFPLVPDVRRHGIICSVCTTVRCARRALAHGRVQRARRPAPRRVRAEGLRAPRALPRLRARVAGAGSYPYVDGLIPPDSGANRLRAYREGAEGGGALWRLPGQAMPPAGSGGDVPRGEGAEGRAAEEGRGAGVYPLRAPADPADGAAHPDGQPPRAGPVEAQGAEGGAAERVAELAQQRPPAAGTSAGLHALARVTKWFSAIDIFIVVVRAAAAAARPGAPAGQCRRAPARPLPPRPALTPPLPMPWPRRPRARRPPTAGAGRVSARHGRSAAWPAVALPRPDRRRAAARRLPRRRALRAPAGRGAAAPRARRAHPARRSRAVRAAARRCTRRTRW